MRRFVGLSLLLLLTAAIAPLGCRAVLGVEERELDTTAADAGGARAPSCAAYCAAMASECTGSNLQFPSESTCLEYCGKVFQGSAVGALDDGARDTLGCRQRVLEAGIASGDGADCQNAGPLSEECGTHCVGYCRALVTVCPEASSLTDCEVACSSLAFCGNYVATPARDDVSAECRMYHLTVAAGVGRDQEHCPHAVSQGGKCSAPAAACP